MFAPTLLALLLQPAPEGPASLDDHEPTRDERRMTEWTAERRRLRLHTGLSFGFAGALLVSGVALMIDPCDPQNEFCELNLGRFFSGVALATLSAIPVGTGIYWGVRLGRHNRAHRAAILRPSPGGFVLHF